MPLLVPLSDEIVVQGDPIAWPADVPDCSAQLRVGLDGRIIASVLAGDCADSGAVSTFLSSVVLRPFTLAGQPVEAYVAAGRRKDGNVSIYARRTTRKGAAPGWPAEGDPAGARCVVRLAKPGSATVERCAAPWAAATLSAAQAWTLAEPDDWPPWATDAVRSYAVDFLPATGEQAAMPVIEGEFFAWRQVMPTYPNAAKPGHRIGSEVDCKVRVYIDSSGAPYDMSLDSCPKAFQQSSIDAVMKWRWYPYYEGGTPEKAQFLLNVRYQLDR